MDQSDGIIIPILRNIGCNIDSKVTSFSQFDANTLVSSVSRCLGVIDGSKYKNLASEVPKSKTKQFRLGSRLSNAVKDLGYRKEVGYETFLYPNENDSRNLIRWLVSEKLPQNKGIKSSKRGRKGSVGSGGDETDFENIEELDEEEEDIYESNLSGRALLEKTIHDNLKSWINDKYSILKPTNHISDFCCINLDFPRQSENDCKSKAIINYYSNNCDFVFNEIDSLLQDDWFLPSILGNNHKNYLIEQIENGTDDISATSLNGNNVMDENDWQISNLLKNLNVNNLISESIKNEMQLAKDMKSLSNRGASDRSNIQMRDNKWQREIMYKKSDGESAKMLDEDGKLVTVTSDGNKKGGMSDEQEAEAKEKELSDLEIKVNKLNERVTKMKDELSKLEKSENTKENEIKENLTKRKELEKEKRTKEKTLALLPNADENLKKLSEIVEKSKRKLENSHNAWAKEEAKYESQLENEKNLIEKKQLTSIEMKNEIKQIRQNMRKCASDIREKEELLDRLIEKLKKLPKSVDRQVYVDRILGVVVNLENQNQQIKSILADVNSLQRETNKISETSKRTFGVTDDLVFKAAQNSKDAMGRKQLNRIYRYIVDMRELFDKIVETVRKISNTQNEIRDLEHQIIALNEKSESLEMKKIKKDVKEVEQENEQLAEQLKKLKKLKKAKKQAMQ